MRTKLPILICMTPIRNEAWVLHAFLKATSVWADHIIIVDQLSTDGSREIALSYPKVTLIDNNNPDFNEAERQKLLIDKAREIEGDKILFGLDADEVFSANFSETTDWQKVLNSKPGDVFWFKWAEICPDFKSYWESETIYYPWVFHDDDKEPHGNYVRNMHSMRIPYPIDEKQMYYINDFRVLHLAYLNKYRVDAKRRFYKFVDWSLNNRHFVNLSRSYAQAKKDLIFEMKTEFVDYKNKYGFDLFEYVDTTSNKFWFDRYIVDRINNFPDKFVSKLDIWDEEFIKSNSLEDQRNIFIKIVHWYLCKTKNLSKNFFVKLTDKIIKFIIR